MNATTRTVTVVYGNHDQGAKDGSMVREAGESAERTARLMRECGYRDVTIVEPIHYLRAYHPSTNVAESVCRLKGVETTPLAQEVTCPACRVKIEERKAFEASRDAKAVRA